MLFKFCLAEVRSCSLALGFCVAVAGFGSLSCCECCAPNAMIGEWRNSFESVPGANVQCVWTAGVGGV